MAAALIAADRLRGRDMLVGAAVGMPTPDTSRPRSHPQAEHGLAMALIAADQLCRRDIPVSAPVVMPTPAFSDLRPEHDLAAGTIAAGR